MDPIDFDYRLKQMLRKSMSAVNILQNIFNCIQQKRFIQVWNNLRVSNDTISICELSL